MSIGKFLSFSGLGATLVLTGCAVGPSYNGPPAVTGLPDQLRTSPHATVTEAAVANWWQAYQDPVLDRLVTTALASNLDLRIAQTRIRQARAGLEVTHQSHLPSGDAKAGVAREQIALAAFGIDPDALGLSSAPLNLYNVEFDASWELDAFGAQKRGLDAARADADAAAYRLADTQVTLIADIVSTYIDLREAQNRRILIDQELAAVTKTADLTRQRLANGVASQFDVGRTDLQVATLRATLAPTDAEIDANLMALAVLCGQAPETVNPELAAPGALPAPPEALPVTAPANLLRNRPDVRIAEAQVAGDTARVGVTTAQLFPQITVQGSYGYSATKPEGIGSSSALQFSLGPKLTWNVLGMGETRARIRQADAKLDESLVSYNKAVLVALQDADGSLSRIDHDYRHRDDLKEARDIAVKNAQLAKLQYDQGSASLLDLIDAERQRVAREEALLTAQAALGKDYAALSKAMGFGWANEN